MDYMNNEFEDELYRIIDDRIDKEIQIVNGKVTNVDEINYTINIERDSFKRTNIHLRSTNISDKGIITIPKLHSYVTLYIQRHQHTEYIRILNYGEIDKYIINVTPISDAIPPTKITIKNDSVSIMGNKLYLNTDSEVEPFVKGDTLKGHIDIIYDLIIDLYNRLVTLDTESTTKLSTAIFDPQILPLIAVRLVEYSTKIGEATANKGLTPNIKSLTNFTG